MGAFLLFHPGEGVLNGSNVELSVRWAAGFGGLAIFSNLCISYCLVRNDPHGVAGLRMSRYRFEKLGQSRARRSTRFSPTR